MRPGGAYEPIKVNGVYRMRNEEDLVVLSEMCVDVCLSGKVAVEIGGYAGEATVVFARYAATVHVIDPWLIGLSLSEGTSMEEKMIVEANVEKTFDCHIRQFRNVVKHKAFDYEVVIDFADMSVDFIYIDAQHTEGDLRRQLRQWMPKLRPGGYIGGHDFCDKYPGVLRAVRGIVGWPDKLYSDWGTSWVKRVDP